MNLFQIQGDNPRPFKADFCVDAKNTCWAAGSKIKWMVGKPLGFIASYCKTKNWKLVSVD